MTQRDGLSSQEPMALSERRAALSLATLFFFRMFGLFLVLPVVWHCTPSTWRARPLSSSVSRWASTA